jgi:hypothetical protein
MEGTSAKKIEAEIEEAVEKIRKAAYSGIKSQMKVRLLFVFLMSSYQSPSLVVAPQLQARRGEMVI